MPAFVSWRTGRFPTPKPPLSTCFTKDSGF
jgi:hypothetical protein